MCARSFTLIVFDHEVEVFSEGLVDGTAEHAASALLWLERRPPRGLTDMLPALRKVRARARAARTQGTQCARTDTRICARVHTRPLLRARTRQGAELLNSNALLDGAPLDRATPPPLLG